MLSVSEAIDLSKELAKAPLLLPKHAKSAPEILACILAGQELGWGPMASLRGLQLVSGKLTLDASAMLGLVVKSGITIAWERDGKDGVARLKMTRGKETHTQEFSREDAKKANLNSDTWKKYEPAMLRARCVSSAVRAFCPDVMAGGTVYLPGEADDGEETPAGAPVVETKSADIASKVDAPFTEPTRTAESVAQQDAAVAMAAAHGFKLPAPTDGKPFDYAKALAECTKPAEFAEVARVLLAEVGPVSGKPAWVSFAKACEGAKLKPRDMVTMAQASE